MLEPDYLQWEKLLGRSGFSLPPSEVQGCLCGYLASGADRVAAWLRLFDEDFAQGDVLAQECQAALHELFRATLAVLQAAEFELDLLLPGDEQPLAQRVAALRAWCSGFLYGLGASGMRGWQDNPETSALLHDVDQISQAEMEGTGKDDEQAYAELVEFLRLAVINIYFDQAKLSHESADTDLY